MGHENRKNRTDWDSKLPPHLRDSDDWDDDDEDEEDGRGRSRRPEADWKVQVRREQAAREHKKIDV